MNNTIYKALFALLRGAIYSTNHSYSIDCFSKILEAAKKQTVDGLIYALPKIEIQPNERLAFLQWIGGMPQLEAANKMMNEQLVSLTKSLEKHNVRYAIMKGQTCAAHYPHPLLRRPGDIDVYIARHDYLRTKKLMIDFGFAKIDETMHHSTYHKKGLMVELHFAVQRMQWFPSYQRLQRITRKEVDSNPNPTTFVLNGQEVSILTPELNLVLLTLHPFNHVASMGLGLRQIIDWMLVVSHTLPILDQEKLRTYLKQLHLTRMFRTLAYICVTYLGMDENLARLDAQKPAFLETDTKMGEKLLEWIIESGNFGHTMELGSGKVRFFRYYGLFFRNCIKYFWLCPTEMAAWPWMKLWRGLTGKNNLDD